MNKEAQQALEKAEAILEKTYKITGETKLFPLALQHAQKALEQVCKKGEEPKVWHEITALLKEKKASPVEFTRKETLVLWTEKHTLIKMNEKKVKALVKKTKHYLQKHA